MSISLDTLVQSPSSKLQKPKRKLLSIQTQMIVNQPICYAQISFCPISDGLRYNDLFILTQDFKIFMLLSKNLKVFSLFLRVHNNYHSHYDVLGVDCGASQQQIKFKYYQLAKKFHPDAQQGLKDPHKFIKINQAYETLGDQRKRRQYDNSFASVRKNYSEDTYYSYQQHHQTSQRSPRYPNSSYYEPENDYQREPMSTLLRKNIGLLVIWFLYGFMAIQVVRFLVAKMDQQDKQRQQMMLFSSPGTVQRRKKMYAKQMKEKNIYGQAVQLKYRTLQKQSTRSKQKRKQGITAIQGIAKERLSQAQLSKLSIIKSEYI